MALDMNYTEYAPDIQSSVPIENDAEMREIQQLFHNGAGASVKAGATVDHKLKGGTLDDVFLLVDIKSKGGRSLISRAVAGPPIVRLFPEAETAASRAMARHVARLFPGGGSGARKVEQRAFWQFEETVPADWHKLNKKVTCSLVAPRLGKVLRILDEQSEHENFYDLTLPIEHNMCDKTPFKTSYGGQDTRPLECSDAAEMSSFPLLNIEQESEKLTISLNIVGACRIAEGFPLGLIAWLEPLRQAGLVTADPRRLPIPPV